MSKLQKTNGKYLWWCLVCLEFRPENVTKNTKHLNLGTNMFDKPNKEAFYIVIHFLFDKLNHARTQEVFRDCWPVWDHKKDSEFRKVAFAWLQEIANEEGNTFPKVAASHLLSAFGPRFVNLMLHLSKHVMLKIMKTFNTDGTWVPEAAMVPASAKELELKRFQLVKREFQRVTVEQDRLIQDYQKRAKALEKSLRDLEAENAKYDNLLKEHDSNSDVKEDSLAKIQKVRGLWSETEKFLSTLQAEREVVASVISGQVDQYKLCGESVKLPVILHERLAQLSQQSSAIRLYKEGQPVLVHLLALLNEGLHILREEREKIVGQSVMLQNQDLQEHALLFTRSKEKLKLIRWKLMKEDAAEIKVSIKKLEEIWESKWANCLKNTPVTCFLEEDLILDLVSPMVSLSFEPASDASFDSSIFSRCLYKPPELEGQSSKRKPETTAMDVHLKPEIHLEPELNIFSIAGKDEEVFLPPDSCLAPEPVTSETSPWQTPLTHVVEIQPVTQAPSLLQPCQMRNMHSEPKVSIVKTKDQILDLECDNLANQFAEAVIMSPVNGSSNVDLGKLLNAISDPFSTRKQLCRTPESLIKDVRSSWRKAVEEGMAEKKQTSLNRQDSLSWLKTPMFEESSLCKRSNSDTSLSFSTTPAHDTYPPVQQGSTLHSTVPWDSSQLEALNSQSASDVIKFSIAHEELPDLLDDVSFNSDRSDEIQEEIVLPYFHGESPLLTSQMRLMASSEKSPFKDSPVSSIKTQQLSSWTAEQSLFSLDLDRLESLSSPASSPAQKLTLPSLVNFNLDEY